jgi:hypothetical protein
VKSVVTNSEWFNDLRPKDENDDSGRVRLKSGGKGIRTPDLLIANETLYQLSYTPTIEDG